ncbi:DUF2497 domain-containing protein [Dankookia rubra]|uniref:DUF2497 domain-containing protein n=2 Tax=Dankookia rubra TaxID=1442381 RepID=A0A4R5QMQ7_9PROT|nr:DUF2497 domain-containing protein [Dankookia rubra]
MEDILASIRRILSEDEASPAPQPEAGAGAAQPAVTPAEDEPLDLTEEMLVPAPAPSAPVPVAPVVDASPPPAVVALPVAEPAPEPAAPPAAEPAGAPASPPEDRALLGAAAAAAAAASVGSLLRAVAADRSSSVHRGGPSIEDVVREELRPLLKDWLDAHLPPLVERLVRAEIERVVGRGLS